MGDSFTRLGQGIAGMSHGVERILGDLRAGNGLLGAFLAESGLRDEDDVIFIGNPTFPAEFCMEIVIR